MKFPNAVVSFNMIPVKKIIGLQLRVKIPELFD